MFWMKLSGGCLVTPHLQLAVSVYTDIQGGISNRPQGSQHLIPLQPHTQRSSYLISNSIIIESIFRVN